MGAHYSFELISIETYAPQFIGLNKIFLGSVKLFCFVKVALIEQAQKIYLSKMIVQGKKCPGNLKNGQSMEIYRFVRNVYKYVL